MNKSVVTGIVVVILVLAGGGVWLAKHNSDNKKADDMAHMNAQTSQLQQQQKTANNSGTQATATNSVNIENFAFSPANITVKKGTTVTWTNKDSVAHTVTETDNLNGPKSSTLATGKSFVFTFDTAGTYHYHCSIHSEMTGTVTVTE